MHMLLVPAAKTGRNQKKEGERMNDLPPRGG